MNRLLKRVKVETNEQECRLSSRLRSLVYSREKRKLLRKYVQTVVDSDSSSLK